MAKQTQTIGRKALKLVTPRRTQTRENDPLAMARVLGLPCFMRTVYPEEAGKARHR